MSCYVFDTFDDGDVRFPPIADFRNFRLREAADVLRISGRAPAI